MADLDFITDLSEGTFKVSLTRNPQKVSGNRALLNRFEITFLTRSKAYAMDDGTVYVDNYGGNANDLIANVAVLNNINSISAGISICIERTVKSMQATQSQETPDNERISGAKLLNIYIQDGIIFAIVEVVPVVTDSYEDLITNLPITKR